MSALRLHPLFTDHAVLQRGRPLPVWGSATPGATVEIAIADESASAVAGSDGRFRATLPALVGPGPFTLTARSGAERVVLRDVLVGEVWLCSGQSNMEWPYQQSGYSADELAAASHERIRLFKTPQRPSMTQRDDVEARWARCEPATVAGFSGVAYAFAVEVQSRLGCPIGLVQSAWGGTAAEWWTPIATLDADPELKPIVDRLRAMGPLVQPGTPEYAAALKRWEDGCYWADPGNKGEGQGWAKPSIDLAEWKTMRLPQHWESAGLNIDGAVWFRREIALPPTLRGRELTLSLGPIDDFDVTYVNGERVGATGKEVANSYMVPRRYPVPARLTGGASVTIAVRVFDHFGNGGICGGAHDMRLHPVDRPEESLLLAGDWSYRVELALEPKVWQPLPLTADAHSLPERLWNGMLAPLAPFALRGAIWYQGESNADRGEQYRRLMAAMIGAWRRAWGYDFPFYQVQLAPFMARREDPTESAWAELREAQALVTRDIPACDLAVIIDSGDALDIHPRDKPLVGRRLARIALARDYGVEVEHSGPRLRSVEPIEGGLTLRFSHCAGGLVARGGPPRGFAIAGEDRRFVWAEAKVDADGVTLRHYAVPKPVAARYGWADNPEANLANMDGLPMHPFRTDTWPGVTTGKR